MHIFFSFFPQAFKLASNALQAVKFQAVQADSPPPPLLAEAHFSVEQSCLMIKNQIQYLVTGRFCCLALSCERIKDSIVVGPWIGSYRALLTLWSAVVQAMVRQCHSKVCSDTFRKSKLISSNYFKTKAFKSWYYPSTVLPFPNALSEEHLSLSLAACIGGSGCAVASKWSDTADAHTERRVKRSKEHERTWKNMKEHVQLQVVSGV